MKKNLFLMIFLIMVFSIALSASAQSAVFETSRGFFGEAQSIGGIHKQELLDTAEKKVVPLPSNSSYSWTCSNGHSGNTGNFCPICGEAKPVAVLTPVISWSYSAEFADGVKDEIDQINEALAKVKLSSVDIDDVNPFLVTTTNYEKNSDKISSISYRGGIQSITLSGEIDESKPGFTYQISTWAYGESDNMDMDKFKKTKIDEIPEDGLMVIAWTTFDGGDVFTVLLPLVP